ncbi:MAG: hypothetical protein ACREVY_06675 [Gammaproteobacteria bacterium]
MEQQPSSLHPKVVEDILEFVHVIGGKTDDIARVLRLHALTEFFLDRIIRLRMPQGSTIADDDRFSYYHKLQIVTALDALDGNTIGALRKLSKVRNRCAHERKPVVSAEELIEIGSLFGAPFRKALNEFDGENREFRALAWALFSSLSTQVTPNEIVGEQLRLD